MGVRKKKTSANLAGLLALPCRIGEFSCVPPGENKKVHTNYQQLVQNFCQRFLANGHTAMTQTKPHPNATVFAG